jgi:hypothetical protein
MVRKEVIINLFLIILTLSAINIFGQSSTPAKKDTVIWDTVPFGKYILHYTDSDAGNFMLIKNYLDNGVTTVEKFFSKKYSKVFNVYVFPNRNSIDKQWSKAWNMAGFQSKCWIVASGVGERLDLLTPSVWKTEACDHDPSNRPEAQNLITHELVHVFQGQLNPHLDFSGMDDIEWFVEGLAVFVSGQLTKDRIDRAVKAIKKGKYPQKLQNASNGDNKCGITGLMVSYIAYKYGKEKLYALLPIDYQNGIMNSLNTNENDFINNWRAWTLKKYKNEH